MALELLLDDAPGVAALALALEQGWATLPAATRTALGLTAATARETRGALVLAPVAEYAELQDGYTVLPDLAAGGQHGVPIVLVADRRLDDIDDPNMDLADSSRTAECYARATLKKFYGITASAWVRDGDAGAAQGAITPASEGTAGASTAGGDVAARPPDRLEVREGGEALHLIDEPGGLVVSDLGRAWFILTGLPPVTHLLLVPHETLRDRAAEVGALLAALPAALAAVHERRREIRRELADRYGASRDLLNAFYSEQFMTLTGDAQKSVPLLFAQGAWDMNLPPVTRLNLPSGTPRP